MLEKTLVAQAAANTALASRSAVPNGDLLARLYSWTGVKLDSQCKQLLQFIAPHLGMCLCPPATWNTENCPELRSAQPNKG